MKIFKFRDLGLSLVAATVAATVAHSPAGAVEINPTSYDMVEGGNGIFVYNDGTYSGSNVAGFLSGGVGELTDGIIAPSPWFTTPAPYVGWRFISPEITFNFAPLADLANVTFRFDNAKGAGGVFLPDSLSFDFGSGYQLGTPTLTTEGHLGVFSYNFTGINVSSFKVRIDSAQEWVMLTEVDFDGTLSDVAAVPEPASWALMIGGFGLAGAALRRRRALAV